MSIFLLAMEEIEIIVLKRGCEGYFCRYFLLCSKMVDFYKIINFDYFGGKS